VEIDASPQQGTAKAAPAPDCAAARELLSDMARMIIMPLVALSTEATTERALDEVLADSFPASDPPSWNSGITRLEPIARLAKSRTAGDVIPSAAASAAPRIGVLDLSLPSQNDGAFMSTVRSLAAAIGLVLLVPFVFLLVGLPIVLLVRGLIEAIGWLAFL
jgi:hypothetical protein